MPKILSILGILASVFFPLKTVDSSLTDLINPQAEVSANFSERTMPESSQTPLPPVKVRIPSINLESAIVPVGIGEDGLVGVPTTEVGWWIKSSRLGEPGAVVLQGHWQKAGPITGVFSRLAELKAGERVELVDKEGGTHVYRVVESECVKTEDFPVQEFYGQSKSRRLHLVTCAGRYDAAKGTYTERTVVYAEEIGIKNQSRNKHE